MSLDSRLAVPVVLWLGVVGRLAAQEPHPHQAEALGRVVFPVSCTPEAQTRFERAVALLHSFWYERAADTFREAVVADTACAMGYWGQAMSLFHPLWTPPIGVDLAAGLAASERGLALARTPRERDYLAAIRTYYAAYGERDHEARLAAYAEAMDGVRRRHPRDREAAIFYALSLIALAQANATDTTFSYQRRADAILEPLFKAEPRHPGLAHYLIHTNDVPQLARLGLYAARRYAEIAPDVPHAQHMPSHIFTRLGLWDDAIASNQRSAAAARQFEEERHLNALWDQRGHAWDYMVYAYCQQGRDGGAHAYWSGQVRIQRLAAWAWLARAAGDGADAVRQARAAADLEDGTQKHPVTPGAVLPARELLGDLLLELGRPVEAAQAFAASLAQQPNRARSLFGLARASEQAGDLATARTRYREYLALMQQGDGARAELEIARGALSGR